MMHSVHDSPRPGLATEVDVRLRPIGEDDLDLLRAILGDPAMTRHVGGPDSETKIRARHHRLLRDRQPGATFAVTVGEDPRGVGWVGYWETEHRGGIVWEAGLSLLPPWQGQGIATRAFHLALDRAAAERRHRFVHSFTAIENGAAARMCERVGFTNLGEVVVPDPKGRPTRCLDWRFELWS
jgi:RimJ/RimL family protein N-acetyltransferase